MKVTEAQDVQLCFNCDGVMQPTLHHNCIRGITDNITQLRNALADIQLIKTDHLDGLKYALEIIERMRLHYKLSGVDYSEERYDPFNDLTNKIRMLLGLSLVARG